jgi:hypothetical protein
MDHSFYDKLKPAFTYKYKIFRAIAKILNPSTITELGTCAGSAIDAYNDGADNLTFYQGYDIFSVVTHEDTGRAWDIMERAELVLSTRGVPHKLARVDLRTLSSVKSADLICVDAGHTYRDAYQDLRLAFRAKPRHVFLDDYAYEVALAFEDIERGFMEQINATSQIDYICGGGLLIELKDPAH